MLKVREGRGERKRKRGKMDDLKREREEGEVLRFEERGMERISYICYHLGGTEKGGSGEASCFFLPH